MMVLITYDVSADDADGRKRLRRVAKECLNYGQRVQNSGFECVIDASQLKLLKNRLTKLINPKCDSIRFYYLGNNYETKIEHYGSKISYNPEGFLFV